MDRRQFLKGALALAAIPCGRPEGTRGERVRHPSRPRRSAAFPAPRTMEYFGGGWAMHMFAGRTTDISLSTLFRSPAGKIVMVDGGWDVDGEFLVPEIKRLGGRVDTWFITHAHSDHYGALGAILAMPRCGGIEIGRVALDFPPLDFIEEVSPSSLPHVREFIENLERSGIKSVRPRPGKVYDFGEGLSFECLNEPDLTIRRDAINNSSICYRVVDAGKSILVTGDVSVEMGAKMVENLPPEKLKCDVCFVAHHGQAGADKRFYEAVRPEICIWPTPQWLWDNDLGGVNGPGSGPFLTNYTKCWMQDLGVRRQILLTGDWRMV